MNIATGQTNEKLAPLPQKTPALSLPPLRLLYRLSLPFTVVESGLMATVSSVHYWISRYFFRHTQLVPGPATPPKRSGKRKINPAEMLIAMQHVEDIADKSNACIFWISGTLLGLERNGRPLDHDYDADLGIMADDPSLETFLQNLRESPQLIKMRPQRLSLKARIQNPDLDVCRNGVLRYLTALKAVPEPDAMAFKLDVFLHFPYRTGLMHASHNTIWWNSNFQSQKKRYGNFVFSVPVDIDRHLTENYGDYKTEVKDFENSVDCPNTMCIFSWNSLVYLILRQWRLLKRGKREKTELVRGRVFRTIHKGLNPDANTLPPESRHWIESELTAAE